MTLPASGPLTFTDIQTEFGGTNPIALNEYYAGGGLVPAGTSGTYGAVPTSGQISVQNFYGTSNFVPVYIEDVFSTYLYTGNGSTQTITNGIDLSTKGGLVWTKCRNDGVLTHRLNDTVRGITNRLFSATTGAQSASATSITAVSSTGYTVGSENGFNQSTNTFVSWTFREQPKFFDIVTFTTDGSGGVVFNHNLGSTPGCIIFKSTSASQWPVYHRSLGGSQDIYLNLTNAAGSQPGWCTPTSTQVTVIPSVFNASETYVGYLFAHDAGGFGLTGTDNVISCSSFTTSGTGNATINLGYEPQWLMVKCAGTAGGDDNGNWRIVDSMREFPTAIAGATYAASATLYPNTSGAEEVQGFFACNSTGFSAGQLQNSKQYIYIACRRGPMKVPTSGTSVFSPSTASQNSGVIVSGFPVDATLLASNSTAGFNSELYARLAGGGNYQKTSATDTQAYSGVPTMFQYNNGISPARFDPLCLTLMFQRAPSFMDVVCYTGNGGSDGYTVNHNLGVVPELMIFKNRTTARAWGVYTATTGIQKILRLNTTAAVANNSGFVTATPTATVFSTGNADETNEGTARYVNYLFATCAGVSKVGSYTGTGALLTVNCGFTSGARYILIKRTDSTGDWFSYNSASGISSGTDPYLLLNSSAVQVTGTNYVDTTSVGFQVTAAAPAELNASGGTYIFLAIA